MEEDNKDLPAVIPPGTLVRLERFDRSTPQWKIDVGRRFRIGYYRPNDGLDCVWLVNETGEYEQTTDRDTLLKFFEIEKLSREADLFGENRRPLPPIRLTAAASGGGKLNRGVKPPRTKAG